MRLEGGARRGVTAALLFVVRAVRGAVASAVGACPLRLLRRLISVPVAMRSLGQRRSATSRSIGKRGEAIAAQWLEQRGFTVLARNLRIGRSEADLLCRSPRGALVVIEVKTTAAEGIRPERQFDARKRAVLRGIGSRLPGSDGTAVRLDLIAVELHPDGAFVVRHHRAVAWLRTGGRRRGL